MDRNIASSTSRLVKRLSLSARRAWIEIQTLKGRVKGKNVALRKESVDRNVHSYHEDEHITPSLSARRAWIEINGAVKRCVPPDVALRKESVDRNAVALCSISSLMRRSPQGERG